MEAKQARTPAYTGQTMVRLPTSRDNTSDRTSLKAGEDACVPGQSLSNTPLKGENIAGEDACVPGQLFNLDVSGFVFILGDG